jgi:hypothetical protein
MAAKKVTGLGSPSNGGEEAIHYKIPYIVDVVIQGSAPILFHAWNVEAIQSKSEAAKGSKEKKTDNVESYVYRNESGNVCIPGEYLRGAIVNAAKFRQDPRSPRKSASDLFKAGIISLTEMADTGHKDWDYLDRRRVMVQRNGVTRERPALRAGWTATFRIQVQLPEYIPSDVLNEVVVNAGRLIGLGDFRPTFGRFQVTSFQVVEF